MCLAVYLTPCIVCVCVCLLDMIYVILRYSEHGICSLCSRISVLYGVQCTVSYVVPWFVVCQHMDCSLSVCYVLHVHCFYIYV